MQSKACRVLIEEEIHPDEVTVVCGPFRVARGKGAEADFEAERAGMV